MLLLFPGSSFCCFQKLLLLFPGNSLRCSQGTSSTVPREQLWLFPGNDFLSVIYGEQATPRRCHARKKWCPGKRSTFYCRLHCGSGVGAGFSVPWVGFLCSVGAGAGWGGEALSSRSQRFAAPGFPAARPRARPSAGETLKIAVTAPASHFRSENGPKMSPKTAPAGPKVGTVFGPKVGPVFEHFLKENA